MIRRKTNAFSNQRDLETTAFKALMPAEVEQAKKLSDQGVIEAMYMASDLTSGWLIWDVDSQAVLE